MFKKEDKLQNRIDELLDQMEVIPGDSPEFDRLSEQVIKLHEAQAKTKRAPVSNDALVAIVGNLAGILIIVGYEKANVVTSKAFTLLPKFRN